MTDQTEGDGAAEELLSYEQARAELAGVVERLEAGGDTLEESLALWERGEWLAEICQRRLDGARARLDAARAAREAPEAARTAREGPDPPRAARQAPDAAQRPGGEAGGAPKG